MTDRRTDGRTDRRTDGGDCNIPDAFLKKRGDNNSHGCLFFNLPFYLHVPPFNPPFSSLIIPIKTTNCLINKQPDLILACDTCS